MSGNLKKTEQRTYRLVHADGLIDITIALFIGGFALIPLINDWMQDDFWSSFLLLPIYLAVFYGYRWLKLKITIPRIGIIRYSQRRKGRAFMVLLTIAVLFAFSVIIGALIFTNQPQNEWASTLFLSGFVFLGFTLASFLLDLPRLTMYGLLCAAAAFTGELLWKQGEIGHHGIPLTFGMTAILILLIGVILLIKFLFRYTIPQEEAYENR